MQKKLAFAFIDEHREEILKSWETLVNHDSGTSDKADVDRLQLMMKEIMADMGAKVRLIEFEKAGNMVIAEFGNNSLAAPVIFSGHIDTVFPQGTAGERPFRIENGKVYGPGVLDMKGGIIAFLYGIKALQAAGYTKRPFKVLLAGDEENGHLYSNADEIFQREAAGGIAAFNCETGFLDGSLVVGRKGVAMFTMETFGVSAHVGNDPENGRSAIVEMAHKLLAIEKLTDWVVGTSFNVGVIEGGTVANATPDYAKIKIDVRFTQEEAISIFTQQLEAIAQKTYVEGTNTKLTLGTIFKPMETTSGVKELFSVVQQTARENQFGELIPKTVGGGADSAYTVLAGVPTVCAMGVKGARNHSKEEYAVVESVFERAKLLAATVLNLE